MASGSAPAGDGGVRIRPLLSENEVPRGRSQDWLTVSIVSTQTGSTK